jgi:hypothetical protein
MAIKRNYFFTRSTRITVTRRKSTWKYVGRNTRAARV